MSSEYAIFLVLGLIALQILTYNVIDRRTHAIALVVSTGIYRGTRVPVWQRQGLLRFAWMGAVSVQFTFMSLSGMGWLFYGRSTGVAELQLLSNLMVLVSVSGVLTWILAMAFFWYSRLSSAVRQAEAD